MLAAFVDDWPRILLRVYYSLRLLVVGVATGAVLGFVAGVAIGWSRRAHYWGHPLLRFIGPVPATAWLPVAVLTWSGVTSVNSSY